MKKAIIIGFVVLAILAAIWWALSRRKSGASSATDSVLPPAPPAQPPVSNSLADPNSGSGLSAVNRRIDELKKSSDAVGIESEVQAETDILKGTTEAKKPYYNQNISRTPITSARKVPYILGAAQKSALGAFASIDPKGGASTSANLRAANAALFAEVGTCFVGSPELSSQEDFDKQVICQGYQNCGKKYKDIKGQLQAGAEKAAKDMAKIADSWLAGSKILDEKMRSRAISDLRSAGWKFIGYDQ